ncbi:MAG: putative peroxiredoxin bcp [Candidatus Heimdallarchaeota archaeon LC_2]|nr:MAG: putative peroxiredoxin bcp [Candidatus Heimdallarchaeota archaeon LC_2]OLS28652.1 MAG: putative peroxiredoxin bcp [Candidatus Heimdallarchaeota archaeon LC_2]
MALKKGDQAPNFTYKDKNGNQQEFHNLTGRKIVFFFPRAFTSTCTKEVCSIQESYDNTKT